MADLPDHRPELRAESLSKLTPQAKAKSYSIVDHSVPAWKRELLARVEAGKPKALAKVIANIPIRGPKRVLPK